MFFDDLDLGPKAKGSVLKVLPPTPYTGWKRPTEFPNLDSAVALSFDVETKETDFDHGPGWARGKGHIVGLGIGAVDRLGNRGAWYFPMRHEVGVEDNFDPDWVIGLARPYLHNPYTPKVGANLIYDVGWLAEENIFVQGELHDVQFAEALLDEDARTALDVLGKKYCGAGKTTDFMYDWITAAYHPHKHKERGEIYRTPPSLVGFYGEGDVILPMDIIQKQLPLINKEGLHEVYRMECDLIYLLVEMRRAGVTIDLQKAETLYYDLGIELEVLYAKLSLDVGHKIEGVNSAKELSIIFDHFGIKYPRTAPTARNPKGLPSFTKDFLKDIDHPIGQQINTIRQIEKIRDTFIKSYILESHVNGKVYGQYHPLRGDKEDGSSQGAKTGRLSSSTPNLQNITKSTELGNKIRYMFKHDTDHVMFGAGDFSQIELRMLVHYAVGKGSDEVRAQYNNDPNTDYHVNTQKLVKDISGFLIPRNASECAATGISLNIKTVNFALVYGQTEGNMARKAGLKKDVGKQVFKAYHTGNPYIKATMDQAASEVQEQGFITTVLGRRTHFKLWEPKERNYQDKKQVPLPFDQAIAVWGSDIKRAYDYKAINYRLQGSAADAMKRAMLECWKQGVYHTIGVPRLTVHDENGHSIKDKSKEQEEGYKHMIWLMENALKFKVPLRFDWSTGATWGDCK
jgi:DNA polymerase I-like protein with 3'-5' exonuclease and polymerase domains